MLNTESFPIGKKQCPKCAKLGKDSRSDNLALYNDGHSYCFSCGYYQPNPKAQRPSAKPQISIKPKKDFYIPSDITTDIPYDIMNTLTVQYHINLNDIITNKMLWSNSYQWLIFPIEHEGESLGFQARNFNKSKPYKWFTQFNKKDLLKLYSPNKAISFESVVLVEDIISAIRVGNVTSCVPLFGSRISDKLLYKIKKDSRFKHLIIWLDSDKVKESLNFSQKAKELGIHTKVVLSPLDPKCYDKQTIKDYLNVA